MAGECVPVGELREIRVVGLPVVRIFDHPFHRRGDGPFAPVPRDLVMAAQAADQSLDEGAVAFVREDHSLIGLVLAEPIDALQGELPGRFPRLASPAVAWALIDGDREAIQLAQIAGLVLHEVSIKLHPPGGGPPEVQEWTAAPPNIRGLDLGPRRNPMLGLDQPPHVDEPVEDREPLILMHDDAREDEESGGAVVQTRIAALVEIEEIQGRGSSPSAR